MQAGLSQNKVTAGIANSLNSSSIDLLHMPFLAAKAAATYSTSVDDNATVVLFLQTSKNSQRQLMCKHSHLLVCSHPHLLPIESDQPKLIGGVCPSLHKLG